MTEKAQSLIACNPRMEQVVKDAAAKVPPKEEAAPTPPPVTPVDPASVCAALKGISSSLLEKVNNLSVLGGYVSCTNGPLLIIRFQKYRKDSEGLSELNYFFFNLIISHLRILS